MNLAYLFEIKAGLDAHIEQEHPRQEGEDRLAKKILALQVELGELANEWRGFKFWSKNQEPRTEIVCHACNGNQFFVLGEEVEPGMPYYEPCLYCYGTGIETRPLLEEYVDCLHFILSIGLELELNDRPNSLTRDIEEEPDELVLMFEEVLSHTCDLFWSCYHDDDYEAQEYKYKAVLGNFLKLGEMLGFTWEQIEAAYLAKNKINHERQVNGY